MREFVICGGLVAGFCALRFSGGPVLVGASWQHVVTDLLALFCFGLAIQRLVYGGGR